jgi:hypothetical protein
MKKLIIAAVLLLPLAAACSSTHKSAPDPHGDPGTRAHVIQEPYGFRNVAFSCYGPDGIYVTSRSVIDALPSGVSVVPNDPNCK